MFEADIGVFWCNLEDMRVKVPKRRWEQQLCPIEIDHRFHGVLNIHGFRHIFLFDDGHACHLLNGGGAFGMGLVVAKIILWPHIDKSDG